MATNILSHNLTAMNAKRQVDINNNQLYTAMERLSSGYKINRAADDASGLSMSEKMRRQIRGLTQGAYNIKEGISYCKTADGALNEINAMLNRMEELAVKSANGTNSENDRIAIDEEIQQLKYETEKILKTTKYNEIYIWQGGEPTVNTVQTGTTSAWAMNITYNAINGGGTYYTSLDPTNKNASSYPADQKIYFDVDETNGIRFYWTGYNGNTYYSNWKAWPPDETAQIPDQNNPSQMITTTHPGAIDVKISDLMDYSAYPETEGIDGRISYTTNIYATQQDVIDGIKNGYFDIRGETNDEAFTYTSSGANYTNTVISAVSLEFPAIIKSKRDLDNTADTSFAKATPSNSTNIIQKPSGSNGSYTGTWKIQFDFENIGTVTATLSNYSSVSAVTDHINNLLKPGIDSSQAKLTGIGLNFKLTANTPFKIENSTQTYTNVGFLQLLIRFTEDESLDTIMTRLLKATGCDIFANTDSNSNSDTGKVGRNHGVSYLRVYNKGIQIPVYGQAINEDPNPHKTIPIHTAPESDETVRVLIDYPILNNKLLGLSNTNALTANDALKALDDIKYASEMVSDSRVLFGSYQNRLEHAYNGTMNTVENTTASESRIRDADMAELTYWYSLNQILVNAGESMLAQATKNPETVLNLLK